MKHASTALFCLLAAGTVATAQPTLTILGTGVPSNFSSDTSVVAGYAGIANVFRFAGGNKTLLGPWDGSGFVDISGDGQKLVATIQESGLVYAGLHDGTKWTTLGGLASLSGTSVSSAYGISDDGTTVVGLGWATPGKAHAFRWTAGSGMVDLGSSGNSSRASGVNADGSVIVGFDEHPAQGFRRPARWVNGVLTVDAPNDVGEYYSCSADGSTVVGSLGKNAAIWTSTGGLVDLGQLPGTQPPFGGCFLLDVSDDGRVAFGINQYTGGPFGSWTPVLWTPELGLVDLATYLTDKGVSLGTLDLWAGYAVSGDGTKLLIHAKAPADTMVLVTIDEGGDCYADCDGDSGLSIDDFICYQTLFALGDPYADCDGDSALTIDDFICFQTSFAIGC